MKKEVVVTLHLKGGKTVRLLFSIDEEYMSRIHFSAIERLLGLLASIYGIRYEIDEVVV